MSSLSQRDIERISQETMQMMVAKASTAGILTSTGAFGTELQAFTALIPANAPARMNTRAFPRTIAGMGSDTAQWKTWLNLNSSQSSVNVGTDMAGSMNKNQVQNVFAAYKLLSKAGRVTFDAVAFSQGYINAVAQEEMLVLTQLYLGQDMNIPNSQAYALPAMTTVTTSAATTGGNLATGTVYIKVAARSHANFFDGGSGPAGAEVTQAVTGPNASVTAAWAAVKGASSYDVYVGAATGAEYYYTTVTTGSVLITAVPATATTNPIPNFDSISQVYPGAGTTPLTDPPVNGNGTPPTVDTSYSINYYNGIIASSLGDYGASGPVTPGTGTPTGAGFIDFGGNTMALSGGGVNLLDEINASLWKTMKLSPSAYMMNSLQAAEVSNLVLGSSSATTLLPPTDAAARTNLAAGGYVGMYVNRAAGGVQVPIEIHPHIVPGTIVARTDRVPFPGSNIGTVFEVNCQYDTNRWDYAANYNPGVVGGGARYDFDIRSMETLINRAPVAQIIASNIA